MIKLIHMTTAFISISLFLMRGYWVFRNSPMMSKKWVKIVPHVNDTVLLITATILAVSIQQYPFVHSWLTAKIIALIIYILLGMFALKYAKEMKNKVLFFILALLTFSYIVSVALTRSPIWFI
ncbi:MAG: SirB2 family protein [Gammaproteobacteria bacterium]|nr:SirB2 family protein [Gammaproteobacteria bacterium]MCW8987510.1 SirB2 family protein [Gammaproteobacteria bacterium]MCW9031185.1 SirB2 family protein [Gammaproteobacteria bacterium]